MPVRRKPLTQTEEITRSLIGFVRGERKVAKHDAEGGYFDRIGKPFRTKQARDLLALCDELPIEARSMEFLDSPERAQMLCDQGTEVGRYPDEHPPMPGTGAKAPGRPCFGRKLLSRRLADIQGRSGHLRKMVQGGA